MATEYNLGRVVGLGIPPGGEEGQTLIKNSSENFDTRWGNSGGHAIQNAAGVDLPARPTMQIIGADVIDDATEGKTVIEIGGVLLRPHTLLSPWDGSTYTIEDIAITPETNVTISLAEDATNIQAVAWAAALPRSNGAAGAGSVSISATNPPTVDIPVMLRIESGSGVVSVDNRLADMVRGVAGGVAGLDSAGRLMQSPIYEPPTFFPLTLQNGFVNSSGVTSRYCKYKGVLYVYVGVITPSQAVNAIVATLPVGYRPLQYTATNASIYALQSGAVSPAIIAQISGGAINFLATGTTTGIVAGTTALIAAFAIPIGGD